MVTKELLNYIKQQIEEGVEKDVIKMKLINNGWQDSDVEEAFKLIPPVSAAGEAPQSINQPSVSPAYQTIGSDFGKKQPFTYPPIRSSKKKLIIAILGIILVVSGVAGYVYLQLPQVVLQKMTKRLANVKTFAYSAVVKGEVNSPMFKLGEGGEMIKGEKRYQSSSEVNLNGVVDIHDSKNPQISLLFHQKDKTEEKESSFGLEARMIGKVFYLQLIEVPEEDLFDLSTLENQWLKIDPEAVVEKLKQYDVGGIEKKIEEVQKKQELSPAQLEKIKKAIEKFVLKFVTKIKKLPNEKIGDINAYHYKIPINKEDFKNLFFEVTEIVEGKAMDENTRKNFEETLELTEIQEVDLWVGKKDLLPYKLSLAYSVKEPVEKTIMGNYNLSLFLKNFNQPVQVAVPEKTTAIEELIAPFLDLFKGLTGSLENEGNNLQEKDLNKSLKNVMVSMNELWAEALLIEEKDGNFDKLSCNGNERLKEICGAIKKETGSNPVIKKPEKNAAVFCIYADISYLANGQEGYVCASNKYTPGIPDTNPAISACNNTNYTCPLPLGEPVLPPSLNEEVLGHLANISIYEGNLKYERDDYNIEMLSCSISPEISKECNQVFTKTGSYPVIKTEKSGGVIGDFCIYVKLPEKENGVDQYGCEMRWSGIITAINPANGYCTETTYDCPMR